MRIPLSWLKEFIPLSLPPNDIAKILTMAGLEVDHWFTVGDNLKDILIVNILETSKHPNADKLTLATVSDGKETYQIVCGAPNCRPGIKTALAPIGVTLKNEDQTYTIKPAKIRGIESCGMLCSEKELGLSESDEGIIELPEHLKEGAALADFYSDTYFDISLTPNLSHCTSVYGVARELSALIEQPLQSYQTIVKEANDPIQNSLHLAILSQEECPHYACRLIRNVKIKPSPNWLKQRLEKCGIRSVNNVVDATNFVLLELGHPIHAFDYDRLEGKKIEVRKAQEGEKIQTLDGKERILQESMLVICDQSKPIGIAGIMGGLNSEINDQTRHVVLESAYFDPMNIRRTSKRLGLVTDASKRFERGTDPNQILNVVDRAAFLIQQIAGGEIQADILEIQARKFPETIVTCRLSRINQLLGVILSRGEVENIFKRLQFFYVWDGQDQFNVQIPTFRSDIKAEIDLIEEVARLYGYENIPRQGGRYQASILPSVPIYLFENEMRLRLVEAGLQEFLTCDLIGPSMLDVIQDHSIPSESLVKVLNPTSVEQSILRTSLLPGLLQVVKYNIDHQNHHISGFEIGRIHFREGDHYEEQFVVAMILTGEAHPNHWEQKPRSYDFFDLKGIVENLLEGMGISNILFKNLDLKTFHSGRQASLFAGELEIGTIGEIHPSIQRRLDVSQRLLFGEFNLMELHKLTQPLEKVKPLAIYPGSERDWTLTVRETMSYGEIINLIQKESSAILQNVALKDIYRSEKLPCGYHNMTLHFVYRDWAKTIEQEVVEAEHQRLIAAVIKQLGNAIICA